VSWIVFVHGPRGFSAVPALPDDDTACPKVAIAPGEGTRQPAPTQGPTARVARKPRVLTLSTEPAFAKTCWPRAVADERGPPSPRRIENRLQARKSIVFENRRPGARANSRNGPPPNSRADSLPGPRESTIFGGAAQDNPPRPPPAITARPQHRKRPADIAAVRHAWHNRMNGTHPVAGSEPSKGRSRRKLKSGANVKGRCRPCVAARPILGRSLFLAGAPWVRTGQSAPRMAKIAMPGARNSFPRKARERTSQSAERAARRRGRRRWAKHRRSSRVCIFRRPRSENPVPEPGVSGRPRWPRSSKAYGGS